MSYEIIQPPFSLKFREMSKVDLRTYFQWFQSALPHRLEILRESVRSSDGFEGCELDYSPASLDFLGQWFAKQITTRLRTSEEIREIESHSAFPVDIPGSDLTNLTFSIAIDVGMYMSQVFLKNYPSLHWDQPLGGKKNVDYGQPVLAGFGVVVFNPVRMMVTHAYGIASSIRADKSLRDIYDFWVQMIGPV